MSEHTAGPLKGMGAPRREETDTEAAREQAIAEGIYDSSARAWPAVAAGMARVPAKAAPVRVRRPLPGGSVDRFAVQVARSVADEVELRVYDRLGT